jgi:predicted Zn finger-like uncharacterized protein
MLIVCPSCATSYDIESTSLQPSGRKVRCARCRTVWHAEPSHADKLLAAAQALAPDREMAGTGVDAPALEDLSHLPNGGFAEAASSNAEHGDPGNGPPPGPEETFQVEAPSIAPVDLDEGRPPIDIDIGDAPATAPAEDIETYAARRLGSKSNRWVPRWPLSRLQSGILVLVILDSIIIGWRTDFVRAMPQTASFYGLMGLSVNLRGLNFEDVKTATEQHEGVPILMVAGNIVNTSNKVVDVPRLKFAVRNAAREEIYSWTAVPPRSTLPPGEAVSFRARLASPPPDVHDVLVRFLNRRDIILGTH